jgi:hypothetical protein
MTDKRVWNCICLGIAVLIATAMLMVPGAAVAAETDLSAAYKLEYSIGDGDLKDQFQVTAGDNGMVELVFPFISGGCIAVNQLKVQSVELADNGVKTVNLLWNCDQGRPCKAYIPVQLQASLRLPEPGKYLIRLWAHETVESENINLIGKQEIELK